MSRLPGPRIESPKRERLLAALIAVGAGIAVFMLANELFPYHSSNHDEGVYLKQAALLLDGQLQMRPGEFGAAVRPWFFVDGGETFYPKYQPLPAAFYAVSMALFGEPRVVLAGFAAGNTALVYALGSMAFDRRVGVLASVGFAVAPMTLLTSSVFLPYAPTTFFNLAFAAAYLRSVRTGSIRLATAAGLAIGVAFFMRPYTAVLFAAPFIVHALWEVQRAVRDRPLGIQESLQVPDAVSRQLATAAVGLVFVALALVYNTSLTGSPLKFPFQAFAPLDGPGFGRRQILSHTVEYTPAVALESNMAVLYYLLTRWVPAGAVGTGLATAGVALASRYSSAGLPVSGPEAATARRLLAALFVSVPAGNVFFWGNYNVLADPSDPADGFLGQFGPFYHFDLLVPVAIFAAAGAVGLWRLRSAFPVGSASRRRAFAASVVVVTVLLAGGVNGAVLDQGIDRNAAHTATYEDTYAPFEEQNFENAVVLLPTPYGNWLNHPFQYLRNDPGLDGDVIYTLDRGTAGDFAVLDAAENRTAYRYRYRGEWAADPADRDIVPKLEQLRVHSGPGLDANTTVGVPQRVSHAVVRIETDSGYATETVRDFEDSIAVEWALSNQSVALTRVAGTDVENASAGLDSTEEVVVTIRLVQEGAGTLTYRQEADVRTTGESVEVIWPPERTVCPVVDDCGTDGTYLPEKPAEHRDGVFFETRIVSP